MSTERSLHDIILENLREGVLPGDFSLPAEENGAGVRFADGAMDGITIYHTRRPVPDDAVRSRMSAALWLASDGKAEEADAAFAGLGAGLRAVTLIDVLQNIVLEKPEEYSAGNVYRTALYLLLRSRSRESVKYGLSLLELFPEPEERVKEIVRRLGLSDEFTVFAVWNMRHWKDANEEIFRLAQKVHGWGRIHALEQLEAQTPQIRHWMLMHGVQNDVLPAYSALTVWQEAQAEEFLRGALAGEEFTAVGRILCGLLDEGPVAGISRVENAEEILRFYLDRAPEFALGEEDCGTIEAIGRWAAQDPDRDGIGARCAEILSSAKKPE